MHCCDIWNSINFNLSLLNGFNKNLENWNPNYKTCLIRDLIGWVHHHGVLQFYLWKRKIGHYDCILIIDNWTRWLWRINILYLKLMTYLTNCKEFDISLRMTLDLATTNWRSGKRTFLDPFLELVKDIISFW